MSKNNIILTTDQDGSPLLFQVEEYLKSIKVNYVIAHFDNETNNYTSLAKLIYQDPLNLCIFLSGSGVKVHMQFNRERRIIASLVHCEYSAQFTRKHNNANVMIVPIHCLGLQYIKTLINIFITNEFDGIESHDVSNKGVQSIEDDYNKCC